MNETPAPCVRILAIWVTVCILIYYISIYNILWNFTTAVSEELIFHYKTRCFYVTKCELVVSVYSSSLSIKNHFPLRSFSFLFFIPLIPNVRGPQNSLLSFWLVWLASSLLASKLLHKVPLWSPLLRPWLYKASVTIVIVLKARL